jgi:hypothetical protein
METSIPFGSPQAAKLYGGGLFIYQQKQPNLIRNMTAPMTSEAYARSRVERQQTSAGMPIVDIMELAKTAGDRIQMDTMDVDYTPPIMGDQNAEGRGQKLSFSEMEIRVDQWTFPVSAGGKMSQQRTPYQLRNLAMAKARGLVSAYTELAGLVHLAGQRGTEVGGMWDVIPQASDPDYASVVVNTFTDGLEVPPPTENRYFVSDGTTLLSGAAAFTQLAGTLTTADTLALDHFDAVRNTIDALPLSLQSVKVADDPSATDDPMWLALVPSPAYSSILTSGAIRTFQQNGMERAKYSGSKSPLFLGIVGGWNGILSKKITNYVSFGNGDVIRTLKSDGTVRSTTVASVPAGYRIYRVIILGAQAMGTAYGKDSTSGSPYSWSEVKLDHGRKPEFAAFGISANKKVTFSVPNAAGTAREPTDFGVIIIDVVAKVPTT